MNMGVILFYLGIVFLIFYAINALRDRTVMEYANALVGTDWEYEEINIGGLISSEILHEKVTSETHKRLSGIIYETRIMIKNNPIYAKDRVSYSQGREMQFLRELEDAILHRKLPK